jgi:hypothetical protein
MRQCISTAPQEVVLGEGSILDILVQMHEFEVMCLLVAGSIILMWCGFGVLDIGMHGSDM